MIIGSAAIAGEDATIAQTQQRTKPGMASVEERLRLLEEELRLAEERAEKEGERCLVEERQAGSSLLANIPLRNWRGWKF